MAALQPLRTIVVPPKAKHTATAIFIHGLGDSGKGWEFFAHIFRPSLSYVKWVLPSARAQPVTINGGLPSPSWFDIRSLDKINGEEDEHGLLTSRSEIDCLISAEIDAGIPAERILLGGFSQGAAMTLLTGLSNERKLAGLAVLSGYLPIREKVKAILSSHAKSLPIFMAHGTADPVVKFEFAQGSADFITTELGLSRADETNDTVVGLTFKSYTNVVHTVDEEEIGDLLKWIKKVLPQ